MQSWYRNHFSLVEAEVNDEFHTVIEIIKRLTNSMARPKVCSLILFLIYIFKTLSALSVSISLNPVASIMGMKQIYLKGFFIYLHKLVCPQSW